MFYRNQLNAPSHRMIPRITIRNTVNGVGSEFDQYHAWVCPDRNDDDKPILNVYCGITETQNSTAPLKGVFKDEPYLVISPAEDGCIEFNWDTELAFEVFHKHIMRFRTPCYSIRQWADAHVENVFNQLHPEPYSPVTEGRITKRWIKAFAETCLPSFVSGLEFRFPTVHTSMYEEFCASQSSRSDIESMPKQYLKGLVACLKLKTTGSTKAEFAEAIYNAGRKVPCSQLHQNANTDFNFSNEECMQRSFITCIGHREEPFKHMTRGVPRTSNVFSDGRSNYLKTADGLRGLTETGTTEIPWVLTRSVPITYGKQYAHIGDKFGESTMRNMLQEEALKFRGVAPDSCKRIEAAACILNHQSRLWAHQASATQEKLDQAREEYVDFKTKMEAIVSSLRGTQDKSSNFITHDGEDGAMVCSHIFPVFNNPLAPDSLPCYNLDYWRAKEKFGRSGNDLYFDASDLCGSLLHDRVVSLVGPPGVGKTSVIREIGSRIKVPVDIVQFTRDKPVEQLVGVDRIVDGKQVFCDGEITEALRHAANCDTPYIIVFDEFDHADASIQSDFHGVCEGRDYTLPSGEVIPIGDNVRFVLTRNTSGHGDTTGRHSAANVSDSAFTSRVCSTYNVTYMTKEDEVALMVTHGLDPDEAESLCKFVDCTRTSVEELDSGDSIDGMSEPVCLRHMISYAAARSRKVSKSKALVSTIIASLPTRDRSVANELALTHMSFAEDYNYTEGSGK